MGQESLAYQDQALAASQDIIRSIEDSFNAAISSAGSGAAGAAISEGMAGTVGAGKMISSAEEPSIEARQQAVSTAMENIRNNAATLYQGFQSAETANAQNTVAAYEKAQADIQSNVQKMASTGVNPDELASSNPDEWNYIVQHGFNGDANVAKAYMLSSNMPNVINSSSPIQTGSTTTYITQTIGPDGKPKFSTQSLDLSSVLQNGEQVQTFNGVPYAVSYGQGGTVSMRPLAPQKPVNAGAYGSYVYNAQTGQWELNQIDPLTGQPIGESSGSSSTPVSPQTSNYITATSTAVGLDPNTPLSSAVTQAKGSDGSTGIDAIINAQIASEGGSPAGVQNNPGNIKYTGLPGQTDSGVQAKDGGTFASYATPEAGKQAMAAIIQNAASGNDASYGPNPTLADYLGTYSNTKAQESSTPTGEYGLLSNVQGFNPSSREDTAAFTYLQNYLSTGKIPTAQQLGFSTRSGANTGIMSEIAQRARDLFYKATGQELPNATVMTGNLKLINGNNSMLNFLTLNESTIKANSDLLQGKISAANINQNAPAVNNVLDQFANYFQGNPDVASYLAQNQTLSNELGSLLALKNASGTTVHDKLVSAGLIDPAASAAQEAEVVNTLMQEAGNAHAAITSANIKLYSQTDPLQLDPQNPLNSSMTFIDPKTGQPTTFDARSLTSDEVSQLMNSGYTMQ